MPWVQGASNVQGGPGNDTVSVTLNGVTGGDCLIVSVGFFCFLALAKGPPTISDSLSNIWLMAGTSPVSADSSLRSYEIYTYVAQDCVAGDTAITFTLVNNGGGPVYITVDEYSDIATVQAIDSFTFATTAHDMSLDTVSSGDITTSNGDLLYSAAFAGLITTGTFSVTAGFTQREIVNTLSNSLASFDQVSTGGTYNNTVTSIGGPPVVLQVVLLSLSPTPIARRIVQWSMSGNSSAATPSTAATFPFDNTAGNLLVAFGQFSERTTPVISDSQGNTWNLVYGDVLPTQTFAVAYALDCAAGANVVTLNTLGGGDDNSLNLIIAEYTAPQAIFSTSSYGNTGGIAESSVDTGDVTVGSVPALLISMVSAGVNGTGNGYSPFLNLGTRRFQTSDSGFLNEQPTSLGIADQIEATPGNYHNVFTPTPDTGEMEAVILGFTLPPLMLICANGFGRVGVPYSSGVTASGGTPPYVSYELIDGGMPPGLDFNTETGAITGTPVTVGDYPYTAQVTDSLGDTATASCIIAITTRGACGTMPTLELTRDLDANWGDHSTFFITQDEPFPFTLRGIVLRLSYNQD